MDFSSMAAKMYGKKSKDYGYGTRPDGTFKGPGFLGELKSASGDVMTEYSIGVNIDGAEMEIPTIVPTLTKKQINSILETGEVSDDIVQKAVEHARKRIKQGKNPFFGPEDEEE